jgi:type IV pilus assembly protein PilW
MHTRRASSGFSLVELMIALTIGLITLSVLATVFQQTSSGRSDLDRVTRLVENSRFTADIIHDDIRHAGFYGTFLPPSDTIYNDAAPCGWVTADVTTLGWQPTLVPPRYPSQLQGWDDPAAGVVAINCLPNRVNGTDVLAIRRVSSRTVTPAQVDIRNVYVQASQCINDAAPGVRVTNTAAQFTLRTAACDPANLAAIRRYFVRVYYVASCNECAPSDGIPTLKRMEIVENNVRIVSLAEGIQDLQFEYAFDIDDDGAPDQFLTTTTVGVGPTTLWSNVVAVRMHVLMRSNDAGTAVSTTPGTFDLGAGHPAETCPNGFKCRLISTTMRLNNVAGRRES